MIRIYLNLFMKNGLSNHILRTSTYLKQYSSYFIPKFVPTSKPSFCPPLPTYLISRFGRNYLKNHDILSFIKYMITMPPVSKPTYSKTFKTVPGFFGLLSWLVQTNMEEVYNLDMIVTKLQEGADPRVVQYQDELILAIERLPDYLWKENWGFIVHTLFGIACNRPNPQFGVLPGYAVLGSIVKRRHLIPKGSLVMIMALNEKFRQEYVARRYKDALLTSKMQLEELEAAKPPDMTQQQSQIYLHMAMCSSHMFNSGKDAPSEFLSNGKLNRSLKIPWSLQQDNLQTEMFLENSFACLNFRTLRPAEFRNQMVHLLRTCSNHMSERPAPPKGSVDFLEFAKKKYDQLAIFIPNLKQDAPWESLLEDFKVTLQESRMDYEEEFTEKMEEARQERQSMTRLAMTIEAWQENVLESNTLSPEEKIKATEEFVSQIEDERMQAAGNQLLRQMRAVYVLGPDYQPGKPVTSRLPERLVKLKRNADLKQTE